MLNELSRVVHSLERLGTVAPSRHPRVNPMGKNRELLVVGLDREGHPSRVEVLPGESAARLLRVEHGSAGSSFPGFNIPTPMRRLGDAPPEELTAAIGKLLALDKNKNSGSGEIAEAVGELFSLSEPQSLSASQEKQFQRSCSELVEDLYHMMPLDQPDLKNFKDLMETVLKSKPTLPVFASSLSELLVKPDSGYDRRILSLFQDVLFGALDWKKRTTEIASSNYWKEKAKQDKNANQPVYLDLATPGAQSWRVAHSETSALINAALLTTLADTLDTGSGSTVADEDAFGESSALQDKFPVGPKVAELGNVKLFSVNTNEVKALQRYGFKGSQSFPISSALVQKMSDALLYLAAEDKRGITCRAIPSAQPDKRDLLVAYLEEEPEGRVALAEMFGGETSSLSDADFAAITQPVLEMLDAKVAANPNLNIRLLSFCPIDKAKKQISLNRSLRVQDVVRAARDWEAGAANAPDVSVWFYDKNAKRPIWRAHIVPYPLELASVINRVWSADAKNGFSASYQRAFSVGDAYDVFLKDSPLAEQKTRTALRLLIERVRSVLMALGAIKTTRKWEGLSEPVRSYSLKAIALLGILLQQVGHQRKIFMQEPITQIGRLLALADGLHQQYCKHVRKGESPSQLLGNALFNTALDQPVFALARLAERLAPYQAWARTFQSNDPDAGVGLVKFFVGQIAACTAAIRLEELPTRMSDVDKAKLLLGYLADHSKDEPSKQ